MLFPRNKIIFGIEYPEFQVALLIAKAYFYPVFLPLIEANIFKRVFNKGDQYQRRYLDAVVQIICCKSNLYPLINSRFLKGNVIPDVIQLVLHVYTLHIALIKLVAQHVRKGEEHIS